MNKSILDKGREDLRWPDPKPPGYPFPKRPDKGSRWTNPDPQPF